MTLISKTIKNNFSAILLVLLLLGFSATVYAQESVTLSISPSLYDISVEPGQEWRSTLRIVNVNNYDLTVYADVVNFRPQGEGGDGRFVPIPHEGGEGVSLAEWITVTKDPIVVPREQSKEIPISALIPFDASPGGHFAAILIGTKPPEATPGQPRVQTSQMITSLFFVSVAGDVNEKGSIREFTTSGTYFSTPSVTFNVRFENKGNVHLQPQGDIRIKNMWGQERGIIPINQGSQFGNVLPDSIRKFTFTWDGEWSVSDIGRYTAEVTLAYGSAGRQFTSAKTVFWVIPFKLIIGIATVLFLFIVTITWLVRLYVKHMLKLAGINIERDIRITKLGQDSLTVTKKPKISAPLRLGFSDLKKTILATISLREKLKVIIKFSIKYRLFLLGVVLIIAFFYILIWYFFDATTDQRSYEITYQNSDSQVKLTSEEIIYEQKVRERQLADFTVDKNLPVIKVVNSSSVPGLGAEIKLKLQAAGYEVNELKSDISSTKERTVIIYNQTQATEALKLSELLNNALLSAADPDSTSVDGHITIFVGSDLKTN